MRCCAVCTIFVCLLVFLSWNKMLFVCFCWFFFQFVQLEKAKYMIFQTYHLPIFFRCLNNNFNVCVIFVFVIVFQSFVHHKSLRFELNHLIAIIRLSQLVIGIDSCACARVFFSLSQCMRARLLCVVHFLYFILFV